MWPLLRRILHSLPPERAHAAALAALRLIPQAIAPVELDNGQELMGLTFPNRIGLAAGFDKSGNHFEHLGKLGFGFIEVGTVTPQAQSGSPPPRLFRLPQAQALINRMGFNNPGADHVARKLAQRRRYGGIVGVNIGPNRDTPSDQVGNDYALCLRKLYGLASYCVINISSPNTPHLRENQFPDNCTRLLAELANLRAKLEPTHHVRMPMLIKVAPELEAEEISELAQIVIDHEFDGVIATNSTTARPAAIANLDHGGQPGGLSGAALTERALQALRWWRQALAGNIVLIGSGGISSAAAARARIEAGANMVQLYTGLIYRGPSLILEVAAEIAASRTGNGQAPS